MKVFVSLAQKRLRKHSVTGVTRSFKLLWLTVGYLPGQIISRKRSHSIYHSIHKKLWSSHGNTNLYSTEKVPDLDCRPRTSYVDERCVSAFTTPSPPRTFHTHTFVSWNWSSGITWTCFCPNIIYVASVQKFNEFKWTSLENMCFSGARALTSR